jgi:hydrogenase expression/formation protein HypE
MDNEKPEQEIRLEHGSGGALSRELVEELIYTHFRGEAYPDLSDATPLPWNPGLLLTTDTYVVDPLFFPGGDIGRLSVFGTCNDLSVSGATPRSLSLALVLEEGLRWSVLKRVLESIARAAGEANVRIVTGDTKVVPPGKGGGIYINTAGVGERCYPHPLTPRRIAPGDAVIVSGSVGSHGIAVLAAREALSVGSRVKSDCGFLHPLCRELYALDLDLRFVRDATRGGVASILNEIVQGSTLGIRVKESEFPVQEDVAVAADLLGLNPLEIANEGVLVAIVAADSREKALERLRGHSLGKAAVSVGEVTNSPAGKVVMETRVGGRRILDFPRGLLLPRIC